MLEREVRGTRELRAALVEQVLLASAEPSSRVLLAVRARLMTAERVRDEWEAFTKVLLPTVASRVALAALSVNGPVLAPTDALTRRASEFLGLFSPKTSVTRPYRWDRKRFEVFGVLFDAWLERETTLPVGELLERAGVSHPTASVTLEALQTRGELARTKSRSVGLVQLPRRSLEELVPRLNELRDTHFYVDGSGRETTPESLLARLHRRRPPQVHVGGISAARELWPGFNLNGLPRVDVTASSEAPADWLLSLDPALQRVSQSSPRVILAVHHTWSHLAPHVHRARKATVVFDLYSLGLGEQAEEFIRHWRP